MRIPPKRRVDWRNKHIGEEKKILKDWAEGELSTIEAASMLSFLHGLKGDRVYTPDEFVENANWLGWFR